MENLSLFAQAIWKCGWFTGAWVAILLLYVAETWAKAARVPYPKSSAAKVVSIAEQKQKRDCREWRRA